jgi:cytochrome c oxidase subunit III
MPSALETVTVVVEPRVPGGGGPGNEGPGYGGDRGGGDNDDSGKREDLYRLGIALLIISIASLFAGLAIAFWMRSQTVFLWQPIPAPKPLWFSTVILILSSIMLELSRGALYRHQWFAYRRRLLLTIYLGLAFIACQLLALGVLLREGYSFRGDPHSAVFYVFTGVHGAHILCGMIALNYLLFRRGRNWQQHRLTSGAVAAYWHFMGVVWIGLFGLLLAW